MERAFFVQLLALVAISIFVVSCVEDDFEIPEITVEAPDLDGNVITLSAFASLYEQALLQEGQDLGIVDFDGNILDAGDFTALQEDFQFTFQNDGGDVFMSGYVISTDESGNFFEEIILQDTPENPATGVRLLIDLNPIFTRYEIGRRLFIRLNGLTSGISNGVFTLGISGDFIEAIPGFEEEDRIIRDVEVATIVPLPIALDNLSQELTNLFVSVENVQFSRADVIINSLTYAGEATDEFDGERRLESCDSNGNIIFSTSTFADFKSLLLPTGRGNVAGVLTRNFFGDQFNFVINDPSGVRLDEEDRCDPEEITFLDPLDCEDIEADNGSAIFSENFESISSLSELEAAGWVIENTVNGNTVFELDSFAGNQFASINAFDTTETDIDTWLVTPEIVIDGLSMQDLELEIQTNFNNGVGLSIFISSNFEASVSEASWAALSDLLVPMGSSNGFGDFESTGIINLSCVQGNTIRIGFRYQGSDETNGVTTRYHLDNIIVKGLQ